MNRIGIRGEVFEWETTVDNRTITITDVVTGEWTRHQDTDNLVGDPDFYDDWENWIELNWDDLIWVNGDQK